MAEHFCTYFDHRYAAKGLAMWRSLAQVCADARLHVLCLDQSCFAMLDALCLDRVELYRLPQIEDATPGLVSARRNRSLVEYYFTLTPCFVHYVLAGRRDVDRLTYVDADLFFFADPAPIFTELSASSIGIIEHRFSDALVDRLQYGRFNVGWLTFRNDTVGHACLERWRDQCLEWCYDRLEGDRFAEQKYLDEWPSRFSGVHVIEHRGANVAPWNLGRFPTAAPSDGRSATIDGDPLLFFHAHGFESGCPGVPWWLNLEAYRVETTASLTTHVYEPYEAALIASTTELAVPLSLALLADQPSGRRVMTEHLRERLAHSEAESAERLSVTRDLRGHVSTLEQRLEASQAETSSTLATVRQIKQRHAESEVVRINLLGEIGAAEARLAEFELTRNAQQAMLESQRDELIAAESTVERLGRDMVHVSERVTSLERSLSWRVTAPLRRLADFFGYRGSRR